MNQFLFSCGNPSGPSLPLLRYFSCRVLELHQTLCDDELHKRRGPAIPLLALDCKTAAGRQAVFGLPVLLHIELQVSIGTIVWLPHAESRPIYGPKGGRPERAAFSRISRASLTPLAMSANSFAPLRACSLLLCLVAASWQLSIREFVVPKAIELGSDAELRCGYELDANETDASLFVKWWWTPESSSSDGRKPIYQRISGQKAQTIHNSNSSKIDIRDNDTIILIDVTPVDSGTYECEVFNNNEVLQHQKLVVFHSGTGPMVNVSEVDDDTEDNNNKKLLLIECHAENVAPKPDLSVNINGQDINMTTIIEDDDHNGFYSVYANTTISNEDIDEAEVRCEIFYSDPNIVHPAYVDVTTFVPTGRDTQSTTEMPEETTQPEATPESLQSPRDDGVRLHSSWILLTLASSLVYLQTIL
ncbi:unnamed protein product [Arctia plantaginis]|uniref:Ig-like domain-containing protein n=1 Tax=Arctia plantaginis TaxID=874455 RepID=A0A8S0YV16_ARCPL|nr:unnamed protein product [Arctia plantaginis]CAB3247668.1 unnamed protein product [Arctia plantaginis]